MRLSGASEKLPPRRRVDFGGVKSRHNAAMFTASVAFILTVLKISSEYQTRILNRKPVAEWFTLLSRF